MKRWEKAWHAVNELVESESRYVQKLGLLDKFREDLEKEKVLEKRQLGVLFANISSLYQFHNQHLFPQLMDRHREWQSTKRISDVLKKQAPFLKMYSEYTNNYKRATQMFEECMRKKKHFEEMVRKIEQNPECENLSLVSHLICPVQRVMRYQLLLKEYQKNLRESDSDFADTDSALSLVLEAASHANEMMRKLDRYRNVLEVQEQLGNSVSLVSPSRELLTKARLTKVSSSTNKTEERVLFVFNDLFLLASERSIGIGSKYKLRAVFDAFYTQICEDCVGVIEEVHSRRNNFCTSPTITSPRATEQNKSCAKCDGEMAWWAFRGYVCAKCSRRYCKGCFGSFKKQNRKCLECIRHEDGSKSYCDSLSSAPTRRNLLATAAQGDDVIKASYVNFRGPLPDVSNAILFCAPTSVFTPTRLKRTRAL
uniref:DH domain-containing protein n=1 Tax=Ditylenchus dipsaci TaxID=166011 RepID=A0A915DIW7_9BILA